MWIPLVALLMIVLVTIAGVSVGYAGTGEPLSRTPALAIFITLLLAAIIHPLWVRLHVLPKLLRSQAGASHGQVATPASAIGYTFAAAPAAYGLAMATLTSQGLLALPFGAIALLAYYVVHSYLDEALGSARPHEG